MTTVFLEPGVAGALSLTIKASLVLMMAALAIVPFIRRGSAAARHFIWTVAIAAILLLPIASAMMPSWSVAVGVPAVSPSAAVEPTPTITDATPITPAPPVATVSAVTSDADASRRLSPSTILATIYTPVLVLVILYLCVQQWKVRRLMRRSALVTDRAWLDLLDECAARLGARSVRLLSSNDHGVPAAVGIGRGAILIPASADDWSLDRRRAVLLHEMAHVVRRDCLTQWLASLACAVYWFHPAVWWIAARLRVERELACDDRVIAAGTDARAYAGHLLDIAYTFGGRQAAGLAVSMARTRHLEGRMLAALDDRRNRSAPARIARRVAVAIAVCLVFVIAPLTPARTARAAEAEPVQSTAAAQGPLDWHVMQRHVQDSARRVLRAAAQVGILQDRLPGTWQIRPTTTEGSVHLTLVELRSSHGTDIQLSQLDGLTSSQLSAGGPVTFRIRRDAGTFTFEGVARSGVAAGTFTFEPNPAFQGELTKRGFASPTAAEQYDLARGDIGVAYLDELTKQGYTKPTTAQLVRAAQHGVNLTYLREMGALGHRLGTLDPLIVLRDHGVTPSFVRGLADEGYKNLGTDELLRTRDHGVTPDYVRAMRDAGYGSLPLDRLVNARDHGISPEYVRQLADAGYRKLSLDEIIRVRDHGVSAEYARDMRDLGYPLALEDLVRARDHGVSVEYARDMDSLGYRKLPIESLIRARDHGVSTDYIRELQRLGYERLPLDDLIRLRDHGLSAERIRTLNGRAGSRLPLDVLKSIAGIR